MFNVAINDKAAIPHPLTISSMTFNARFSSGSPSSRRQFTNDVSLLVSFFFRFVNSLMVALRASKLNKYSCYNHLTFSLEVLLYRKYNLKHYRHRSLYFNYTYIHISQIHTTHTQSNLRHILTLAGLVVMIERQYDRLLVQYKRFQKRQHVALTYVAHAFNVFQSTNFKWNQLIVFIRLLISASEVCIFDGQASKKNLYFWLILPTDIWPLMNNCIAQYCVIDKYHCLFSSHILGCE